MSEHDEGLSPETAEQVRVAAAQEATFDLLMKKPRRVLEFNVIIPDDAGEPQTYKMRYRAIPSKEFDTLVASCPPKPKEKADGATYDVDRLAPQLIAAVSDVPKLSVEQAQELYTNPDWAGGEVSTLWINALRVCNAGLDVAFSDRD